MVVYSVDAQSQGLAQSLAEEFQLNLVSQIPEEYYLSVEGGHLVVRDPRQGPHFSIQLDFSKEIDLLKRQQISIKKDLLCRAVGFKSGAEYKVWDGTMGMGKDSVHLCHLGCSVVGSEVDPIAFALVRDALARESSLSSLFEVLWGDTYETIKSYPDVVNCLYLDPMFEDLKKKSAPKKAMAMLRTRNITSTSIPAIIEAAIEKGIKRIVVKRPIKGKQLYSEPTMDIAGKLVRYDVYIR